MILAVLVSREAKMATGLAGKGVSETPRPKTSRIGENR